MAKAKKLPSGSWRCLVYDYTDDKGKRKYKSFTSTDPSPKGKRDAELRAAQYAAEKQVTGKKKVSITLGQAWDKYIEERENILSPTTIREYKATRKNSFESLMDTNVYDITQDDIQSEINKMAEKAAPKTIRNKHGLLYSVMQSVRPDFAIHTALPKKVKPNLYIPSDQDVKTLLNGSIYDPDMHIAIMLAAFGPLRRSEICALDSSDIRDGILHVNKAMVKTENNTWVIKKPKSYAGDRRIALPDFVLAEISNISGSIVKITPSMITNRFSNILERCSLQHFRFHDLRHYCASRMHSENIPDAYIMERGGWENAAILDDIYRHALSDQSKTINKFANDVFTSICNTKCNTKNKKPSKY